MSLIRRYRILRKISAEQIKLKCIYKFKLLIWQVTAEKNTDIKMSVIFKQNYFNCTQ